MNLLEPHKKEHRLKDEADNIENPHNPFSLKPSTRQFILICLFAFIINILFQVLINLLPSLQPIIRGTFETIAFGIFIIPFVYFFYVNPLSIAKTKVKKSEDTLLESELRYKMISELTSDFVYKLGVAVDGKVSLDFASDNFYTVSGYHKGIPLSIDSLINIFHPDDRNKVTEHLKRKIANNQIATLECRAYIGDGKLRHFSIIGKPVWDEKEKRVTSIIGAVTDITERKKAEEAQAKTQHLLAESQRLAHIGSWETELSTGNTVWSEEMYRIFELPIRPAFNLESILFVLPSDEQARFRENVASAIRGDSPYCADYKIKRSDGKFGIIHDEGQVVFDKDGTAIRMFGTTQDVTNQKQAEEALLESQRQIEFILGATKTGLDIIDAKSNLQYVDPYRSKIYGSWEGKKCYDYFESRNEFCLDCSLQQALQTKQISVTEQTRVKEGNRPVQITAIPYQDKKMNWLVAEVIVDITERKKAEEALQVKQSQLTDIIEFLPDATLAIDKEGHVIIWNEAIAKMTGIPAKEMIGKGDNAYAIPFYGKARAQLIDLVFKEHAEIESRYTNLTREGDTVIAEVFCNALYNNRGAWVFAKSSPLHDQSGNIIGAIESIRDITERKQAEEALKESEEKFRSITEQSADGIVVTDENGIIVEWNEAQEVISGLKRSEVISLPASEVRYISAPKNLSKNDYLVEMKTILKDVKDSEITKSKQRLEHQIVLPDGSTKIVSEHFFTIRQSSGNMLVSIVNDITEQKKAENDKLLVEKYLQQAQKMESLGVLAGGIAHDFNNILMGIFGFTDLARSQVKDEVVSDYLSQAMESMERAKALTQQLLTFAKGGAPVKKTMKVSSLIKDTCHFALSGSNVKCSFSIPENLWNCNIDKNQIGQVIDNVMINAMQAMPMGGTIEVAARNALLQEREHPTLAMGNYVLISIKDQGIGISKEMLNRIFDPFFTTKTKGHGLGLAISHSIITRHDGAIDVKSELDKGTTFYIYLPASEESFAENEKAGSIKHTGTGRVLVLDDEEAVRTLVSKMLQSFGYSVITKEKGKDTIDFFTEETRNNATFKAIILDLTIPGEMGGKEVVEELRKLDNKIPIFVASGYAADPIMAHPQEYGFTASISKPFKMTELMELLEKHVGK
jgi:PAS domain S-box-containing protein